jgi:anti-sigma B factor antagonist
LAIDIHVESTAQATIVAVEGEVDLYSSPGLRQEIKRQLKKKPAVLVVELSRVDYMDSSGVATLVEALKNLTRDGGRLRLAGLTDPVKQVFRFAHLDKVFDLRTTLDEALSP